MPELMACTLLALALAVGGILFGFTANLGWRVAAWLDAEYGDE